MAGQRGAAAPGEQPEPVVEAFEDLLGGQHPRPDRGQLDRQRQAVEAAAQVGHGGLVGRGQLERAGACRGPLGEQADRLVPPQLRERRAGGRRQVERRYGHHVLARHRQRLPAGGDHPYAGGRPHDLRHQRGDGAEQVLAVVHHQQQPLVPQVRQEQCHRLGRGLGAQVQGRRHGVADQPGIADLGQLDQPRAAGEPAPEIARHPQRQPRLADPAGTDQADQPGLRELAPDHREFTASAHETGRLGGQVARTARRSGHGGSDTTTAPGPAGAQQSRIHVIYPAEGGASR
ncbi:hypothetical protein GCM10009733_100900 [Nonomuraea maheshkhaliensis]|uniref:Uncharacterized protein n=1 Tax=Nonomuraea maheshkhaliensis TaxID=419590 RepID=A0ABN2HHM1_9ACTN